MSAYADVNNHQWLTDRLGTVGMQEVKRAKRFDVTIVNRTGQETNGAKRQVTVLQ